MRACAASATPAVHQEARADPPGQPLPVPRCIAASGRDVHSRYGVTKSSTSCRSVRNTPPVPPQVLFMPNEVIPATMFVSPRKFGPPESPKHVPPLLALLESSIEKSPVKPVLICSSHGYAT